MNINARFYEFCRQSRLQLRVLMITVLMVTAIVLLMGCGGGGGNSNPTPTVTPLPTVTPSPTSRPNTPTTTSQPTSRPTPTQIPTPTPTRRNTPTPTHTPTPTSTPAPITILNPGFEDGLNNWVLGGAYSIDFEAHSGLKALKLGDGAATLGTAQQDIAFTEVGASITLSGYGKITTGSMMSQLAAHFYSDDACTVEVGTASHVEFMDTSAYQFQSVTFNTPAGIRKIRVKLTFNAMEPGQSTLIDDLNMVEN